MDCYKTEIAKIGEQLKVKTLGELQAELGTSRIDYTGVGFGYQLKENRPKTMEEAKQFLKTGEFDEIAEMVEAL